MAEPGRASSRLLCSVQVRPITCTLRDGALPYRRNVATLAKQPRLALIVMRLAHPAIGMRAYVVQRRIALSGEAPIGVDLYSNS